MTDKSIDSPCGVTFTPWPSELRDLYQSQGVWRNEPLAKILESSARQRPDAVALICGERQWSYRFLNARANQVASGFTEAGIKAGDAVVVQLPNVGEFFEVIFALFKIGAVPIMALHAHRSLEVTYFCRFSKAKAYVIAQRYDGFDFLGLAEQVVEQSNIKVVVTLEECTSNSKILNGKLKSLAQWYKLSEQKYPPISAESVALMQLSGGTTSVPKLIPRTHNDYFYSIRKSVEICGFEASTVYLAVLPIAHNFTLSSPGSLGVFFAGGCVVLAQNGSPDNAFPLIERHKITHSALVPPLAITWLNAVNSSNSIISSLNLLQVGGAKLSASVAERLPAALGCQLQQVFGMAEGLVNFTRLEDDAQTIFNYQGRPMSDYDEIKIVDDDDNPLPNNTPGNLLTRGPYTIRGYYCADEHNRTAFTADGFYRTGDIALVDDVGNIMVQGRVKDQINRGGEKISAEEVENQLLTHPHILDVALVGVEDEYLGERSYAYIRSLKHDGGLNLPKLKRYLRERGLAEYKHPDRVVVVDSFPLTSFGKVSKKALRTMAS